ncbi:MAG TPA: hypothetical protein ENK18_01450 [Deltaproteobacteria bacterium]|nr:hypothetical protein [Deltaproteobacteria bacterium]
MPPVQPPTKLKQIAILQLISGVLNVCVMAAAVSLALGASSGLVSTLCGASLALVGCPIGCLGPLGSACGFWGLLLLPIGIGEIVSGITVLAHPQGAVNLLRLTTLAELSSLLFGGVISTVVGVVSLRLLRDDEVVAYLEG